MATASCSSGRRQNFNFIDDVVAVCSRSLVYVEIQDREQRNLITAKPKSLSNGSGFVVKEDGLILTNAHVVVNKPNTIVSVLIWDGSTHIAQVEDVDLKSDLVTLRIPVKNLPTMKFGSTADIMPGEWVVAMGSPLSLSNTVTAGVVSSTQRASKEVLRGKDMIYIQTDAPITFGNSGGPLLNLDGEAIAINNIGLTSGISFAIPIDYAEEFLAKSEKTSPPVYRRYLGITTFTLTPNTLMELTTNNLEIQYDNEHGIFIWKVIIGSSAHKGGLQTGDIITALNGTPVTLSTDVNDVFENVPKELTVQILRRRTRTTVTLIPELHENE